MKSKKSILVLIILTFIFILLYTILAARPLGVDHQFNPEWKINITNPTIKNIAPTNNYKSFKLGQSLGYFTEDGDIIFYKTFPSKAAVSDHFFATYSTDADKTIIYDYLGNEKGELEAAGFPNFFEDRIYVFLPGGNSFVMADSSGKTLWKVENTIPITAFSSKSAYTAAGYADGTIKIINNSTGIVEVNYAPGGSDYPIILGLDVSEDGQYIASISGHNRQRFVLSKKENNQPKIIYHRFLDSDVKQQTLVKFCDNDSKVIYNMEKSAGIYDLALKQDKIFNLKNKNSPYDNTRLISISESDNLIFLLGKCKEAYTVYIFEKNNSLAGTFCFNASSAFLSIMNEELYIGKDLSISKISLSQY